MANVKGMASNSAVVALVAATAKTVANLATPANRQAIIKGLAVTFDGVSVTATPVRIRFLFQTNAGTGTALTPTQKQPAAETIQCTAKENCTVEPTGPTEIYAVTIHPQAGYEVKFPLGEEIILKGSGFFGIEITAAAAVDAQATIDFEE